MTEPNAQNPPAPPAPPAGDPNAAKPPAPPAAPPAPPAPPAAPPPASKPDPLGLNKAETPEQKAEREKAEAAAKKNQPPAEYKFELKDEHKELVNDKEVEAFTKLVKEKGVAPDVAKALLEGEAQRRLEYVNSAVEAVKAQRVQQDKDWFNEIKAMPEFATPEKLKQANEDAAQLITRFGDPGLMDEIEAAGYARHPRLFRLLAKAGAAMRGDKFVPPAAPEGGGKPKSDAEVFFPDLTKK